MTGAISATGKLGRAETSTGDVSEPAAGKACHEFFLAAIKFS
jgi:hypothetical protein